MCNVCFDCSDQKDSDLVADTGVCSKCGKVTDCWDHDLLACYRQFGVSDDFIWSRLPRLLDPFLDGQRSSMLEIGKILSVCIEAENRPSSKFEAEAAGC